MDDVAAGPRVPTAAELAEDEGFEAFIMGAQIQDNPYLLWGAHSALLKVLSPDTPAYQMLNELMDKRVGWERGWRMAARYNGRREVKRDAA